MFEPLCSPWLYVQTEHHIPVMLEVFSTQTSAMIKSMIKSMQKACFGLRAVAWRMGGCADGYKSQ